VSIVPLTPAFFRFLPRRGHRFLRPFHRLPGFVVDLLILQVAVELRQSVTQKLLAFLASVEVTSLRAPGHG